MAAGRQGEIIDVGKCVGLVAAQHEHGEVLVDDDHRDGGLIASVGSWLMTAEE